ncbi:thymidylate kinase [Candidatus Uhrbacteria bacterium]|nr:thymidylate kinase [Candidatus Uhrbacteria bacterium]
MQNKGKLIIIDGSDGTGKATQTTMLVARLRREGHHVKMMDFPRYGKKSASLVEEYLNGKFGTAKEVGPYRSSIFFAVDRYAASPTIRRALDHSRIVIANRYVTSSMAHRGGEIQNVRDRRQFFRWLDDLEFGIFGIPRPDLTIVLHVPAHIAQTLIDQKTSRAYIHGKKRDIHEADLRHLKAATETYRDIVRTFTKIKSVECVDRGRLLTPAEVHARIWEIVRMQLKATW